MKRLRVLVVDDSAYNRLTITQMLESDAGIEVVGTATDGVDAIAKTLRLAPDIISLDLEMPGMDGYTFLRWLMKEQPTPVLVLSSRSDSMSVFRALELGAVDFLAKPESRISRSLESLRDELVAKVLAVRQLHLDKMQATVDLLARGHQEGPKPAAPPPAAPGAAGPVEVVAVASSTGGPQALQALLTALPPGFGTPIVISQHMPPGFTRSFADRLSRLCAPLAVREAAEGDRIQAGTVLIAPGGSHLTVRRDAAALIAVIEGRSSKDKYVPSADRMMLAVAEACGPAVLGVVLTGMGNDGAEGVVAIKRRGGQVFAESEESAVIFGMPQEAIRTGAVDKVLPLERMAPEIAALCSGGAAETP